MRIEEKGLGDWGEKGGVGRGSKARGCGCGRLAQDAKVDVMLSIIFDGKW
jgi:hypothetical protein